jgi:hypothetical protein
MLGLGAAAASFAWWWNYNRGHRTLEFFGPEAATLIRTAPKVELLPFDAQDDVDISKAAGLLNARTSLLSDASYVWPAPRPPLDSPSRSVRFTDGNRSVVIDFDFENQTVRTSSTGRIATLTSKTAAGWQAYLARITERSSIKPPGPARRAPSE